MLTALLEAAVRGGILLAVIGVLLKMLSVRDPAVEKNTWTLAVAAALAMPLLSWTAGLVASPVRMVPLTFLPSGSVTSMAAVTGVASGTSRSLLELVGVMIYAVVATLLLARFLIGLWIGARLRRDAFLAPALRVGSMDVRVSKAIHGPASFASTILLPLGYETWDTATLNSVLAHEQAHICNLDCYRLWLAALYRALFWFDPLAHWVHWRLRALSELTSDEAAAAAAGDRVAYAATLQRMASATRLAPSIVGMADARSLDRRLRRLLSERNVCLPLARARRALLLSAVLVTVMLMAVPWAGALVPVAKRPALLEFHLVDDQNQPGGAMPSGDELYRQRDGTPILLRRDAVVTSDEITSVVVGTTPAGAAIDIRLDARGAASMLRTTRDNLGNQLATVYKGRVINHAVILGVFGQRFQVTGLTGAEAHAIAMKFARATKQ